MELRLLLGLDPETLNPRPETLNPAMSKLNLEASTVACLDLADRPDKEAEAPGVGLFWV